MYQTHDLLNLVCDLAFIAWWAGQYRRVVPHSGCRRIVGVAGWLLALAAYVQISTSIFTRWGASTLVEDVWSKPLGVFDKVGVLTLLFAATVLFLANRGAQRSPITVKR